jgi:hypothetical protein
MMVSQPGYDDWVIVCFDYFNVGASPLSSFHSGMLFDFNVYNAENNIVRSDTVRRFTYMMRSAASQFPAAGVRLLQPAVFRNLSAIDNAVYVEPSSMMTEAAKDSFLKGHIRLRNSTRTDNWSICVSAGPFTIPAGGKVRVVYAVVGGNDSTSAKVNSDSAQSWWDQHNIGVGEGAGPVQTPVARFAVLPNPARDRIRVAYAVPSPQPVRIRLFDVTGRERALLYEGEVRGSGAISGPNRPLPAGIYFVQIEASGAGRIEKVVFLE